MKLIRTRLLLPLLAALFLTVGLTACGSSSQPAPTDTSADVVGIYRLQHISAAGLDLDADALVILTAVEKVSINYNKPNQKGLDTLTVDEAKQYIAEGHFAPGSMLPKVEAAIKFVESKKGRKSIITSLDKAVEALEGKAGTVVC